MAHPGYDDVVLVTGFPLFYARNMVRQILATEPRTLVYLVVPAKLEAESQVELEALPADQRERVVLLEGDAAAMDLGLSGAEFRVLTREVDRIHHIAHESYSGADRRDAERMNVRGAAEILELARACSSLECLVFHSTARVSGDRKGLVSEDDLDCHQGFQDAIEETRFRAEVLVRRAMREALPIAVVRPATLVGDSLTGEIGRLDGPYLLILLIVAAPAEIAIPLPGAGEHPLSLVPVDHVVRAAQWIGRSPAAIGRTFHLTDPDPLPARRVFELVARAGGRRTPRGHIPPNVAKALLRTPGVDRLLRNPRSLLQQLTTTVRYDRRNTDQILAGTGIECPPFESYVEHIVSHVQEHVRMGRERQKEGEWDIGDDPLP